MDLSLCASAIATTAGLAPDVDVTEVLDASPLDFDHRYTYDKAGNLAKVEDLTGLPVGEATVSPYVVREYTFTAKGARAGLSERIHADGPLAGTATTGKTQTLIYDTADRPSGGYVYDVFGRQTTVTPAGTTTTTRHYADDSDNPAWVDVTQPNGLVETTRFAGSISGDIGAYIKTDGAAELALSSTYGDIATTVPISATAVTGTPAETIAGWAGYEEYGELADSGQASTVAGPVGCGWLGAKGRAASDATAGLTLMGVRLYNQATGTFTSTDPVPGGNSTAYNYPTDPINMCDQSGKEACKRKKGNSRPQVSKTRRQTTGKWHNAKEIWLSALIFGQTLGPKKILQKTGLWKKLPKWAQRVAPSGIGIDQLQKKSFWIWTEYKECGKGGVMKYWYRGYSFLQYRAKYSILYWRTSWVYLKALHTSSTGRISGRLPG